jgi:hypothetical protein
MACTGEAHSQAGMPLVCSLNSVACVIKLQRQQESKVSVASDTAPPAAGL